MMQSVIISHLYYIVTQVYTCDVFHVCVVKVWLMMRLCWGIRVSAATMPVTQKILVGYYASGQGLWRLVCTRSVR